MDGLVVIEKLVVVRSKGDGYPVADCWVVAVPQQYPFLPVFYCEKE